MYSIIVYAILNNVFLKIILLLQQIQAQTIIIIHPGSMYLRIGRASDLNPNTLLNAVARRRLQGGLEYKDSFLPPMVPRVSLHLLKGYCVVSSKAFSIQLGIFLSRYNFVL